MSTTIDNKVVEMRFDNKQFESATAQSMSTIDKLTSKLKFKGAANGLEDINKAAKNVNMSGIGTAVDSVSAKFSALQVMGVTALANITNSAVNAGKRIVSALTIDPVKTGFQEYETQINAVQTILANTQHAGTTLTQVTKALDELNTYADKTIYNFTEMTRNIGTFTAAGVDLNTSVTAIQGIANLAAVSGSTSQQASTAMYQLSQALAAGTVKLMDWNSVVNAGMGGKVFQDALMETARVHGIAIDSMIEENGSFRETLQEGWLTADVLTETLEKFTATTDGLTEAEIKANREMWKAKGYTEDQIDAIFKLGEMSTNAATKVKTLTQLWDVLKESAQSGWAKSWQLIIGDFEEAKSLWTSVADVLTNLINKMSDARNKLLESALGMGFDKLQKSIKTALGPIEKVMDSTEKVTETVSNVTGSLEDLGSVVDDVILGKFGNGQERFDKLTESGQNYYKVQNKVNETLGDSFRYTEEQIAAQDKLLSGQTKTVEQTGKAEKSTAKLTKAQKKQLKEMVRMTKEQAKAKGYTDEQIEALNELRKTAEKLGMPLDEFIDKMDEINGRWLLINSFKNVGEAIAKVFNSIGKAFREVFDPIKPEQLFDAIAALHKFTSQMIISDDTADKLQRTFRGLFAAIDIVSRILGSGLRLGLTVLTSIFKAFGLTTLDVTASIGDLIYKFDEWLKKNDFITKFIENLAEKLPPIVDGIKDFVQALWIDSGLADNFHKIADGLESIWIVVKRGFTATLTSGVRLLTAVLGLFGTNMAEVLGKLAEWVTKVVGWIDKNTMLTNSISKIAEILKVIIDWVKVIVKDFLALEPVQKLIENIANAFKKLGGIFENLDFSFDGGMLQKILEKVNDLFSKIHKGIKSLGSSEAFQAGLDTIEGLAKGLASGIGKVVSIMQNIGRAIIDAIKSVLGIHSPSRVMIAIGGFIVSGLIIGILGMIPEARSAIHSFAGRIKETFQNGFSGVGEFFSKLGDKIKTLWQSLGEIDWSSLFVAGTIVAVLILLKKLLDVMDKLVSPIANIGNSISGFFNKVGSSIENYFKAKTLDVKSKAILNIAKAIALLAGSFYLLSKLEWSEIGKGAVALVGISGALVLLTFAASKMNSVEFGKLTLFMLGFAASVLILSKAVQMLSDIYVDDAITAVTALTVMMGGMATLLYVFGKLIKDDKVAAQMGKAGNMFMKMSAAMLIMAIAVKTMAGIPTGDIVKGVAVIAGLTLLFVAVEALGAKAEYASGAGSMILKMAIALAVIPIVIRMIAGIPNEDIIKGLAVIAGVELLFAAVVVVSYFAGAHASKAGSMLLKMSIAIGILAMTMKLFATIDYEDILKGLFCIRAIEVLFAAFLLVSTLAQNNGNKAGSMMFKMAAGIAVMALAIKLIATIPMGDIIKGLAVIAAIEVLFGAMIVVTNLAGPNAAKAGSMMLKMSAAILVLVAAIAILSLLDPKDVVRGTAAISAMLLSFAAIAYAASKLGNCMKELIVIAATIGLLVGAIVGLTFIDRDKLVVASASLSVVMGMLAILVASTKLAGKASSSMFLLVGVIAALGIVLKKLGELPIASTIANAAALSLLVITLSASLVVLSKVGNDIKGALAGVLALLVMAVPLLAFVGILKLMEGVEHATKNAIALSVLAGACSLMLIPLTAIGAIVAGTGGIGALAIAAGIASLTAMAVPLLAFVGILKLMDGIENANKNVVLLTSLMNVLLKMLTVLAIVGPFALIGLVAITGLVTFMLAVGTLATIIGGVMTAFPQLESFLNKGIPILEKLAYAVGSFAGNLIKGFSESVASALPKIGQQLSAFMVAAIPFINGAKLVDDTVLKGVGILAACIGALVAANLLENITSFITLGSSFSSLGTELSKFIVNATPFILTVKSFTPEMFEGVKSLVSAIFELTKASFIEGITRFLPISSSLSKFGAELPKLAEGLKGFVDTLGTFTEEQVTSVKCAADCIKTLSKAADKIDGQSDWAKKLFGDNSLAAFSSQLPLVAISLRAFVEGLGTFTEDQVTTVKCAGDAINAMAEAASNIDGQSDWAKKLFGDNSLSEFASDLPATATALSDFVNNLGTFTEDQVASVKCAANAIKVMAQAGSSIDGQAEWAKKLFGDNGLGAFSDELPAVATNLKGFVTNLGTFGEDKIATTNAAVGVVKALAKLGNADLSGMITYLPMLGDKIIAFADDLKSFVSKMSEVSSDGISDKLNGLVTAVGKAAKSISEKKTDFNSAGSDLTKALGKGISSNKDTIISKCNGIVKAAKKGITDKKDAFEKAGKNLGKALISGIKDKNDDATKAGKTLANEAKKGAREKREEFETAGGYLAKGLIKGINDKKDAAYQAGFELGERAAQGEKDGQRSNSPSKLTYQAGLWLGEGLVNGIAEMGTKVYRAGYNLGDSAASSMSNAVAKVSDLLSSDIDTQPTIRPVLDLSEVESGAGAINGIFGMTPSVGVMSNLNAVSTMMNRRIQNGSDSEVVSAIKKLGKDLGNIGGNSYTINGVSYEESSDVADALATIVRAAKVERRI